MSLKKFNRKGGYSMGGIPPGSARSKRGGAPMEIKNNTIPGQSINPDGFVRREDEPKVSKHEAGPQQDDLIRGKHLRYDKEGNVN